MVQYCGAGYIHVGSRLVVGRSWRVGWGVAFSSWEVSFTKWTIARRRICGHVEGICGNRGSHWSRRGSNKLSGDRSLVGNTNDATAYDDTDNDRNNDEEKECSDWESNYQTYINYEKGEKRTFFVSNDSSLYRLTTTYNESFSWVEIFMKSLERSWELIFMVLNFMCRPIMDEVHKHANSDLRGKF